MRNWLELVAAEDDRKNLPGCGAWLACEIRWEGRDSSKKSQHSTQGHAWLVSRPYVDAILLVQSYTHKTIRITFTLRFSGHFRVRQFTSRADCRLILCIQLWYEWLNTLPLAFQSPQYARILIWLHPILGRQLLRLM